MLYLGGEPLLDRVSRSVAGIYGRTNGLLLADPKPPHPCTYVLEVEVEQRPWPDGMEGSVGPGP